MDISMITNNSIPKNSAKNTSTEVDEAQEFSKIFVKTMLKSCAKGLCPEGQSSSYMDSLVIPILADKIVDKNFPLYQQLQNSIEDNKRG
ncbi:hypothetical protein [Candidatus Uabimicrobium amorphum]|uniref:Uncharacterized protein n=1 Tax=Uabimicrobium amorphum TaxID=2596890 RepID=A0A5S9IN61_UABAM|nr:hypothetical protein [Candidatus Uabimicrobium amorphum]BBM84983.1 hypothetical protein UABAM_03346 [Candidatus Uabimicrobium amorphum]